MKKVIGIIAVLLAGLGPGILAARDNLPFTRAQRAMDIKDYTSAIALCLGILETSPTDYDVNFLLARAYSYSGRWDQALSRLETMDTLYPRNPDVMLLQARILTWRRRYDPALSRYREVLEVVPDNEEALIGTGDIAARQGESDRALAVFQVVLERNPDSADAYFHLGLLFQWQGNRSRARENFEKAVALDPSNGDYRSFLTDSAPRLRRTTELRYQHEIEDWSDGRGDFQTDRLALQLDLPRRAGVVILKASQTRRLGETDSQFGVEGYPRLWSKAYARFELAYASPAVAYPRWSYLAEIYQGFFKAGEASLGFWRMSFPDRPVTVGLGSLGWYLGNWYPYLRLTYSRDMDRGSFSWVANLRKYFSDEDFVYAGFGRGGLLLGNPTVQDLLAERGTVWLAGFTWYPLRHIRLEGHFSRTTESGLARNAFLMSTGYRWR